jgi:ParB-like chromosome segregation protein Spo0J
MPPLSDEEFAALKEDIRVNGVLVAIEYDEQGNILDGHHRTRAIEELRAEGHRVDEIPRVFRRDMSEEQKRTYSRKVNMIRRHLSSAQKRDLIKDQLMDTPEMSDRYIAAGLGLDHKTVGRIRGHLVASGDLPQFAKSMGLDGKLRPREVATKPKSLYFIDKRKRTEETERLLNQPAVIARMFQDKLSSAVYANRLINREAKAERHDITGLEWHEDDAVLRVADIRDGLPWVADNSVDLIVTDPPYAKKYMELYSSLASLAGRVLRDGGSLLCMTGQANLPEVMRRLCAEEQLRYHWAISYLTTKGGSTSLSWLCVSPYWKPILWFCKGAYKGEFQTDVLEAPADYSRDKEYHKWGQSVGAFETLIEHWSLPGQLVLGPFLGGGAAAVAAMRRRRRFIGSDISEECIETTQERMVTELAEAENPPCFK